MFPDRLHAPLATPGSSAWRCIRRNAKALKWSAADVIILGGGLVGLTLAIALDRHGLGAIVVDPADPEKQIAPSYDGRATAVSSSSWRMLETIGVAERLAGVTCAIRAIRVSEGLKPGGIAVRARGAGRPARHHGGESAAPRRLARHRARRRAGRIC